MKHKQRNTLTLIAAAAAAVSLSGVAIGSSQTNAGPEQVRDANDGLPTQIKLAGVARDFRERSENGGHPDFERRPSGGFGHYAYMVADELDDEGKPVFASTGTKVTRQYKDRSGNQIMPPRPHVASRSGDQPGRTSTSSIGASTTAEAFAQWFRDVPTMNLSMPLELTLERQEGSDLYVFDDRTASMFYGQGGFFPVNGELFGNSAGESRNYHFTFEMDTTFVYKSGSGQQFTFRGDDDVWVFIDGKCVIDIGGVHGAVSQTIDLDRLEWLEDGAEYSLKFFFAERHRTQSNFRIETTLALRPVEPPKTSALYD